MKKTHRVGFVVSPLLIEGFFLPLFHAVLWIRDILVGGSGSSDPYNGVTDPDSDPDPALFVSGFQDIDQFYFFEGIFTTVFKNKKT
jgi:hypothetical protein